MSETRRWPVQHSGQLSRGWSTLVWLVALLDGAAIVSGTFLIPLPADTPFIQAFAIAETIVSFGVVGAFLATRRRQNPIGWLFWSASLLIFITVLTHGAAVHGGWSWVSAAWLAWISNEAFIAAFLMVVLFVPLLFPDGRLPSPRWRPLATLVVLWLGTVMFVVTFAPGPIASPSFRTLENPLGIAALRSLDAIVTVAIVVTAPACLAGTVMAPVWRYRHGSPIERQQVKWFATATVVTVGALVLMSLAPGDLATAIYYLGITSFASIPIAIAIAILRHRLYEIDRIVSRTVGYATLTAILAATFWAGMLALQSILAGVTNADSVAIACSTLVVVALFQPLRRRVQGAIDRRFYRARYDAARTVQAFAGRLRDKVDLDSILADLDDAIRTTIGPSSASVWLRPPGREIRP